MLLVVLLSAAPTGGQLQVRAIGSAFAPATSAVTVSPKRARVDAVTTKTDRKDGDAGNPPLKAATAPAASLAHAGFLAAATAFAPDLPVPPPARLLALQYPARAPPLG